jgi:DNA polymerase-3 subunit delta
VKEYQQAMRSYPLAKVIRVIHYLRLADLQAKGVEAGHITEGQIMKELIYKILH